MTKKQRKEIFKRSKKLISYAAKAGRQLCIEDQESRDQWATGLSSEALETKTDYKKLKYFY